MKALRKHRGNYNKVYDALKGQARKMFPKSSKTGERYTADKSRSQLRWYIGRTAFDFVTATGQHQKSTNRKQDRRSSGNSTGARRSTRAAGGTRKSTRKPATAQRRSGGRSGGSTRKAPTAKRSTTKRKSVKR